MYSEMVVEDNFDPTWPPEVVLDTAALTDAQWMAFAALGAAVVVAALGAVVVVAALTAALVMWVVDKTHGGQSRGGQSRGTARTIAG